LSIPVDLNPNHHHHRIHLLDRAFHPNLDYANVQSSEGYTYQVSYHQLLHLISKTFHQLASSFIQVNTSFQGL
jgi:hypothetical protein